MAKKTEPTAQQPETEVAETEAQRIENVARKLATHTGFGRVPFEARLRELGNVDAIAAMIASGDIDDALAILNGTPPAKDPKAN